MKALIVHPVLGKLTLQSRRGDTWWSSEDLTPQGLALSVSVPDAQQPSEEQVSFYIRFAVDHSYAFAFAAPLVVPKYEEMMSKRFPDDWQSTLDLVGIGVPLDASLENKWDLTFECRDEGHGFGWLFICHFACGKALRVGVDT